MASRRVNSRDAWHRLEPPEADSGRVRAHPRAQAGAESTVCRLREENV